MKQLLVELVDRAGLLGGGAHGGVDLGRAEPGGKAILRNLWQLLGRCGKVALVRDRDHIVAQPEREEQLGGVRDEGDDAHETSEHRRR